MVSFLCFIIYAIRSHRSKGGSNRQKSSFNSIPSSLHQNTPFFIGSEEDVKEAEEFLEGKRSIWGKLNPDLIGGKWRLRGEA